MKKLKTIKAIFLMFTALAITMLITPGQVLAIAQMTKPIEVDNALRGQDFQENLILLNNDEEPAAVDLVAEGQIADWVLFFENDPETEEAITETTIPASATKTVVARFLIPDDTPNGTYEGFVSILSKAPEAEEGKTTATIKTKISRDVSIQVTDEEIIDFSTTIIPEKYDLDTGENLKFKADFNNEGNISIKPQIQVELRQNEEVKYSAILPFPHEAGVKPMSSTAVDEMTVLVPDTIVPGKMRADFTILYNGETVDEKQIIFNIKGETAASSMGTYAYLIGAIAIAGAVGGAVLVKRKKKKSKK